MGPGLHTRIGKPIDYSMEVVLGKKNAQKGLESAAGRTSQRQSNNKKRGKKSKKRSG